MAGSVSEVCGRVRLSIIPARRAEIFPPRERFSPFRANLSVQSAVASVGNSLRELHELAERVHHSTGDYAMNLIRGNRLYVNLSASQARRRLAGYGFGVRKVRSNGRNEAVIIHTATGQHLRELRQLFIEALPAETLKSATTETSPAPAASTL